MLSLIFVFLCIAPCISANTDDASASSVNNKDVMVEVHLLRQLLNQETNFRMKVQKQVETFELNVAKLQAEDKRLENLLAGKI